MKNIKSFLKDESGQGLVEYGLLIGLIALGAIGAVGALGTAIDKVLYDEIVEKIKEVLD